MARKRLVYLVILVTIALGTVIAGLVFWLKQPGSLADADDATMVALGERVYGEYCASCHGARLQGQPNWRVRKADGRLPAPPHDDNGHSWHHPDQVLFEITKGGPAQFAGLDNYESDMPAFEETLSDEEIWAAIAYIKSQWSATIRARQKGFN